MTTSTTELNTRDVHGSIPMHIDSSDEEDGVKKEIGEDKFRPYDEVLK